MIYLKWYPITFAVCSFGEYIFHIYRLTLTDNTHTVLLCLYVAEPDISWGSNSILETVFSFENNLFIQLW